MGYSQIIDGEEWTAERALSDLIGAIDAPEDYTNQIDVLTNAVNTDTDDSWKDRYERLREDYRKRFVERMNDYNDNEPPIEPRKDITIADLDFDGLTE